MVIAGTAQYLRQNVDGTTDFVNFTGAGIVTIKKLTPLAIETILNAYTALAAHPVTPAIITILLAEENS